MKMLRLVIVCAIGTSVIATTLVTGSAELESFTQELLEAPKSPASLEKAAPSEVLASFAQHHKSPITGSTESESPAQETSASLEVAPSADVLATRAQYHKSPAKKKWTFLVYIAARNDLYPFSKTNIRQMLEVGSNGFLNIVVQLDEPGKKGTQRFYIEKNNPVLVYQDNQKSNSGDPECLINFCRWGVENYPAEHYALILWDHGTGGSIDPHLARVFDSFELFSMPVAGSRPAQKSPLWWHDEEQEAQRGICFDEMYRSYLNNQALIYALTVIKEQVLQGRLWDIIGLDACLMADVSTLSILKEFAHYMVTSEDVEPGTGWNYRLVLSPFQDRTLTAETFAQHIVSSYAQAYCFFTNDYTQSAIDLRYAPALEQNINNVALLLTECLKLQRDRAVRDALQISCNRRLCTCFDEPSYKDLHHLYINILKNTELFKFVDEDKGAVLREALRTKLNEGMALVKQMVVANAAGKNVAGAQGISIYFPEARIHSSFPKTSFAKNNAWFPFLTQFLSV